MRPTPCVLSAVSLAVSILAALGASTVQARSSQLLSRAELKVCIQREEELGRRQDALRTAQEVHALSGDKLSAQALELARILRATDPNDAVAVDLYNQRNDARNADVEVHNKRAETLNATLAELQEAEADFITACTARPFLKVDETAVLKELGLKERRSEREKRQAPARPTGRFSA